MAKKKEVIPTVDELAERIREAMKNQGTYSPDLEFAVINAATNYRLLLIARKDVSKLSIRWLRPLTGCSHHVLHRLRSSVLHWSNFM